MYTRDAVAPLQSRVILSGSNPPYLLSTWQVRTYSTLFSMDHIKPQDYHVIVYASMYPLFKMSSPLSSHFCVKLERGLSGQAPTIHEAPSHPLSIVISFWILDFAPSDRHNRVDRYYLHLNTRQFLLRFNCHFPPFMLVKIRLACKSTSHSRLALRGTRLPIICVCQSPAAGTKSGAFKP